MKFLFLLIINVLDSLFVYKNVKPRKTLVKNTEIRFEEDFHGKVRVEVDGKCLMDDYLDTENFFKSTGKKIIVNSPRNNPKVVIYYLEDSLSFNLDRRYKYLYMEKDRSKWFLFYGQKPRIYE